MVTAVSPGIVIRVIKTDMRLQQNDIIMIHRKPLITVHFPLVGEPFSFFNKTDLISC